jgi:hypothetical protein
MDPVGEQSLLTRRSKAAPTAQNVWHSSSPATGSFSRIQLDLVIQLCLTVSALQWSCPRDTSSSGHAPSTTERRRVERRCDSIHQVSAASSSLPVPALIAEALPSCRHGRIQCLSKQCLAVVDSWSSSSWYLHCGFLSLLRRSVFRSVACFPLLFISVIASIGSCFHVLPPSVATIGGCFHWLLPLVASIISIVVAASHRHCGFLSLLRRSVGLFCCLLPSVVDIDRSVHRFTLPCCHWWVLPSTPSSSSTSLGHVCFVSFLCCAV